MEIAKVIQTIRDLTNRTVERGCTEAEAFAAAEKVGELLKVYDLSMDKVFLGEAKCVTIRIPTGKSRRGVMNHCVWNMGKLCDCKMWIDWDPDGTIVYEVFGLEPDTQMVRYLYEVVQSALNGELDRYQRTAEYEAELLDRLRLRKRSTRAAMTVHLNRSFKVGMSRRISRRFLDMFVQRERDITPPAVVRIPATSATAAPGTNLVVVKRRKVEEEYEKLGLDLTNLKHRHAKVDVKAYDAGKKAGDRVNLSRPLNGEPAGFLE